MILPHIIINKLYKKFNELHPIKTDLIFKSINPSNLIKRDFKPLLQELGLSKKVRIHDFRNTHASLLIDFGIDMKQVSNQLGHSSISITMDLYGHLLKRQKEANELEKYSQKTLKKPIKTPPCLSWYFDGSDSKMAQENKKPRSIPRLNPDPSGNKKVRHRGLEPRTR